VAAVSAAAFAIAAVCDRRSSAAAMGLIEMHARASDAKIGPRHFNVRSHM